MNDLCLGNCGTLAPAITGALEYLDSKNLLDIKNFHGTSGGALIGLLYIVGYKPREIVFKMENIISFDSITYDFINVQKNLGIIQGGLLDKIIEPLFEKDIKDKNITIGDFSNKTGVNINIYVTDTYNKKRTNFNNIDNPKVKLSDALKASMSIPILFEPVKISDIYYTDGGICDCLGTAQNTYIHGYTIIILPPVPIKKNKYDFEKMTINNLLFNLLDTIRPMIKPQSTYTISIHVPNHERGIAFFKPNDTKYLNTMTAEYYKTGLNAAKEQLE